MQPLLARFWRMPPAVADQAAVPGARYVEQRQKGFGLLRFFDDLELQYQRGFFAAHAVSLRATHLLAIVAILGFIALDALLGLQLSPPAAYQVLCLVSLPALLVPLVASFQSRAAQLLPRISLYSSLALGASIAWVVWLGEQAMQGYPSQAVLVVTMYVYFLSGLMWAQAVLCGGLLWLAFVVPAMFGGSHDDGRLLYEAFYLLLVNSIGIAGRYAFEYQDRRQFLMQGELRYLADYDGLTGLLNRRAFAQHAQTAWAMAIRERKSVSVLMLDLDFLKRINDRHGHLTGDVCLRLVAEALRGMSRRPLDACSRFGGDEFVVLWYDADPNWLAQVETELRRRLDQRSGLAAELPELSVTGGGVHCWPQSAPGINEVLSVADDQLYGGKERGRATISWIRLPEPEAVGR